MNDRTKSINRETLTNYLNVLLRPENFEDYGPNGLQIEGSLKNISKIAFSVSATKDSIEKCVEWGAHALIVHHGLFWKFHGVRTITNVFAKRVKPLIQNDINLYGYHLPLDAHMEIGNAFYIAQNLGLHQLEAFYDDKCRHVGVKGTFMKKMSACEIQTLLERVLNHGVLLATENADRIVKTIGIVTGGASQGHVWAVRDNLDAYLTGEMSEHDWHDAKESGIHMFAGGHYATEEGGVKLLMEKMMLDFKDKDKFQLEFKYISSDNQA